MLLLPLLNSSLGWLARRQALQPTRPSCSSRCLCMPGGSRRGRPHPSIRAPLGPRRTAAARLQPCLLPGHDRPGGVPSHAV